MILRLGRKIPMWAYSVTTMPLRASRIIILFIPGVPRDGTTVDYYGIISP